MARNVPQSAADSVHHYWVRWEYSSPLCLPWSPRDEEGPFRTVPDDSLDRFLVFRAHISCGLDEVCMALVVGPNDLRSELVTAAMTLTSGGVDGEAHGAMLPPCQR